MSRMRLKRPRVLNPRTEARVLTPKRRAKEKRNDCKSDTEQDYFTERHHHCRSGKPRCRSRLDAKLRPGSHDLPHRLQDLEDAARSDETGPAVVFPDAGREGQSRLWRVGRG